MVWVRDCDPANAAWDYDVIPPDSGISNELYLTLAGARKPVLFIEGDARRSIDAKLYPLVFPDFTTHSLGSCNKVIEATRTFNDLSSMHKLDSFGIVTGHDPDRVFGKVKRSIIHMFKADVRAQALLHTRHRVKRTVEYRVDARFDDITTMERHLDGLLAMIEPRKIYENFCREFHRYADTGDYAAILKVYNQKSMLPGCNVAGLCGYSNKDEYIHGIIGVLRHHTPEADKLRCSLRCALGADREAEPEMR